MQLVRLDNDHLLPKQLDRLAHSNHLSQRYNHLARNTSRQPKYHHPDDSISTVFESFFFEELNPGTDLIEISSETTVDSGSSQERAAISFAAKSAEVGDPISMNGSNVQSRFKFFWKLAMKEEYDSLIENGTWELVNLPLNRKPIDCKWVYKTKRNDSDQMFLQ